MSPVVFSTQLDRLKTRFGAKSFDAEFARVIWQEVRFMSDEGFTRYCDISIGSRMPHKPPLIAEFREAVLNEGKSRLAREVAGALDAFNTPRQQGLKDYLAKEFPGCQTLAEAVQVRRLQIQVARADNPDYDPMKDPKWL